MNNRIKELVQPITWLNNCNESAVAALRYLAEHPRPAYGNSAYNTEHLYQIASELMRMASQNLYSQDYVSALNAALKLNLCRIAELESQLLSGFTPEALAQEERAENAEQRIAGLEQALELERENSQRVMSENHQQAKHIARLEHAEQRLCAANVSLDARAELAERENAELEQRLALVREQRDNELRTNAELEKQLAARKAVPPGYKLAPNEPTESMVIDGFESDAFLSLADAVNEAKGWPYGCAEAAECVTGIFKAMLARVPAAPEVKP